MTDPNWHFEDEELDLGCILMSIAFCVAAYIVACWVVA